MAINWNDPSKNTPADLDALRQFIHDTDPTVNNSHLYRPTVRQPDTATPPARGDNTAAPQNGS